MFDTIITHDGRLHADEATSVAILLRLSPQALVIRSRDQRFLETDSKASVILDQGEVYDATRLRFDHHQPDRPRRDDGTPYSSLGLVWKHYGAWYLERSGVAPDLVDRVHQRIENQFVRPIDILDNREVDPAAVSSFAGLSYPTLIENFNISSRTPSKEDEDAAFHRASEFAASVLETMAHQVAEEITAQDRILDRILVHDGGPILELDAPIPFSGALQVSQAEHIEMVLHPRRDDWALCAVPVAPGRFAMRRLMPCSWAGLQGPELARVTRIPGAKFCHLRRFIATAENYRDIRAMGEQAIGEACAPGTIS